jgi:hypothetical protein
LTGLAQTLADIEQDSSKASLLLLDADQYAANLVALVKAIVLKVEAMQTEATGLQAAMEAITAQDALRIAAAAGRVKDAHIRELMLCQVSLTHNYWSGVAQLISGDAAGHQHWADEVIR